MFYVALHHGDRMLPNVPTQNCVYRGGGRLNSIWQRAREQPRLLAWRKPLAWMHMSCGILIGLLLLTMGLSGATLVLKDQLDIRLQPALLGSQPPSAAVTLDRIVAAARERDPGEQPMFVDLATQPAAAVYLSRDGTWYPSHQVQTVFVDRGTALVRGVRAYDAGALNWLMHLHTELWMGSRGAAWLGGTAWVLIGMIVSGYLLWWPGRTRWRRAARIDWNARWPRLTWDLHQVVGLFAGLPLLLQASTAFALALPVVVLPILAATLPGSRAELNRFDNPPRSAIMTHHEDAPLAALASQAYVLYPRDRIQNITLPAMADDPVVFVMGDQTYLTRGAQARLAFDRYTGKLLSNTDTRRAPAAVRAYVLIGPLHFGRIFGLWSQLLWVALGLTPAALFLTGFVLWFRRVVPPLLRASR